MAILLVLANHLLWSNPSAGSNRVVRWLVAQHAAGWIGVDAFFVLSGFLITGILYDALPGPHFFRNFYARRTLRIFPLYYGFFALLLIVTCIQGRHWTSSLGYFLSYTENLKPHGIPEPTDAYWVNINHFWSLAIEEQFYLFWPLLVFLLRRPARIAAAAALGAGFSVAVRFSLWHTAPAQVDPYLLYSWTPARLDELFTGALLAIAVRGRYRDLLLRCSRPVLVLAGLGLVTTDLLVPGLQFEQKPTLLLWLPSLLACLFGALIVEATRAGGALERAFSHRVLRFFGRYSYGLYVFHFTLAALVLIPLRHLLDASFHSRLLGVLLPAAVTLGLSIALALLSFHLYERPFLRLKRHFEARTPRPERPANDLPALLEA